MMQDIKELERDIEQARARLDLTIDRLQDKLSVSGIVDDVIGVVRANHGSTFDHAMAVIRRNPVPVMLVAAGLGWLMLRMTSEPPRRAARAPLAADEERPVLDAGPARVYEPASARIRPMQDTLESRRDLTTRA
jgi:hypothetical protein